jgi:hypothetical protein
MEKCPVSFNRGVTDYSSGGVTDRLSNKNWVSLHLSKIYVNATSLFWNSNFANTFRVGR